MILELIIKYLIIITLTFCHEMGHILMCIIFFKCKDWKIDMGLGKVLFACITSSSFWDYV